MKIDIEGMDHICIDSLSSFKEKPKFVSIESEKVIFENLVEEIEKLCKLGYDRFLVSNQANVHSQKYNDYTFKEGSSGAFGHTFDINRWVNKEQILETYREIFVYYTLLGDYGLISNYKNRDKRLERMIKDESDFIRSSINSKYGKDLSGWYDTHATRSEFLEEENGT